MKFGSRLFNDKPTTMKRFVLAMIAMATMVACGTQQPQTSLENTEWKLIELNGAANEVFAADPDTFFLTLSSENGLTGVGACNNFFGSYTIGEQGALTLEPMGMTRMACHNMELEDEFVKALYEVDAYSIEGEQLSLYNDGTKVAVFNAVAAEK